MFKVICVTNRRLVNGDFIERMAEICGGDTPPDRVILREKDMSGDDYHALAETVKGVCAGVPLSVHSHWDMRDISGDIHLSYGDFTSGEFQAEKENFDLTGVSVHTPEEAEDAERLGADYVIAGHIFPTGCKKGLPPRGLDFLRQICGRANIPVYAIGGITPENAPLCIEAGAAGVCVMSGFMSGDFSAGDFLRG
ncbi:MAG: thiamine phosphate synthase [Ruminococcus sp.]|nr:thiamine phosphate synthase [Ruminococcus sp.]